MFLSLADCEAPVQLGPWITQYSSDKTSILPVFHLLLPFLSCQNFDLWHLVVKLDSSCVWGFTTMWLTACEWLVLHFILHSSVHISRIITCRVLPASHFTLEYRLSFFFVTSAQVNPHYHRSEMSEYTQSYLSPIFISSHVAILGSLSVLLLCSVIDWSVLCLLHKSMQLDETQELEELGRLLRGWEWQPWIQFVDTLTNNTNNWSWLKQMFYPSTPLKVNGYSHKPKSCLV